MGKLTAVLALIATVVAMSWWLGRDAPRLENARPERAELQAVEATAGQLEQRAQEVVAPDPSSRSGAIEASGERATLVVRTLMKSSIVPVNGGRLIVVDPRQDRPVIAQGISNGHGVELDVPTGITLDVELYYPSSEEQACAHRRIRPLDAGQRKSVMLLVPPSDDSQEPLARARLVDGETQFPLSGATLRLVTHERKAGAGGAKPSDQLVLTDVKGILEWSGGGRHPRFEAQVPGYERLEFSLDTRRRSATWIQTVELYRSATLLVHVERDGQALADREITVEPDKASSSRRLRQAAQFADNVRKGRTDEYGSARWDDCSPHLALTISVEEERRALPVLEGLVLEPGEFREITVGPASTRTVGGLLFDEDSSPVAGVEIWMLRQDVGGLLLGQPLQVSRTEEADFATVTNAHGRFEFLAVPTDSWWIGPSPKQETVSSLAQSIEVTPDGSNEFNLYAYRNGFIEGRVLGADGIPVVDASVTARPLNWLGSSATDAIQDGVFRIGPLEPGTYSLTAMGQTGRNYATAVQAAPGAVGVELRLMENASLLGLALCSDGSLPTMAQYSLRAREVGFGNTMGPLDSEGRFNLGTIRPGTYDLVVTDRNRNELGLLAGLEVQAGSKQEALEITLEPCAWLRVQWKGSSAAGWTSVWQNGAQVAQTGMSAGPPILLAVPPGALSVESRMRWGTAAQESVQASAGETVHVVFDFTP